MVRAMSEAHLKDRKRSTNLTLMQGSRETIDQLAITNSVRWHGHVLRREDGHLLRRALDIEAEGQRKKGRSKEEGEVKDEVEKAGRGRKYECWLEEERCTLPFKVSVGAIKIAAGLR